MNQKTRINRKSKKKRFISSPTSKPMELTVQEFMDLENRSCEACGHEYFKKRTIAKLLPMTHPSNNTGEAIPFTLEVYICDKCHAKQEKLKVV